MASLESYIAELNTFANTLENQVNAIILEDENEVIDVLQQRLMDTGLDAKKSPIGGGQYAPVTIENKKKKGQEIGHFTLFNKGDFHGSMFIQELGKTLFITSRDAKTNVLIQDYGEDILGLTNEETAFIVQWTIDPEIQKTINKLPQTIDI